MPRKYITSDNPRLQFRRLEGSSGGGTDTSPASRPPSASSVRRSLCRGWLEISESKNNPLPALKAGTRPMTIRHEDEGDSIIHRVALRNQ